MAGSGDFSKRTTWRCKLGLSRPRAAKNQPRTSKQACAFQQVVVTTTPALAAQ